MEAKLAHTHPNHQYATASQLVFPSVLVINSVSELVSVFADTSGQN
ncbi:hypothetical protein [Okeania hirsuta]|nr:hypothetical protein [Okeania hirsuta]